MSSDIKVIAMGSIFSSTWIKCMISGNKIKFSNLFSCKLFQILTVLLRSKKGFEKMGNQVSAESSQKKVHTFLLKDHDLHQRRFWCWFDINCDSKISHCYVNSDRVLPLCIHKWLKRREFVSQTGWAQKWWDTSHLTLFLGNVPWKILKVYILI